MKIIITTLALLFLSLSGFAQIKSKQTPIPIEQILCAANGRYVIFAQRPLAGKEAKWQGAPAKGTFADKHNVQFLHEHIFFCNNGKIESNIGFRDNERFSETIISPQYERIDKKFNSDVITDILDSKEFLQKDGKYSLLLNNCQDFAERVRQEYRIKVWEGEWEGTIDGRYTAKVSRDYKLQINIRRTENLTFTGEAKFEERGGSNKATVELQGTLENLVEDNIYFKPIKASDLSWCVNSLLAKMPETENPADIGNIIKGFTSDWCGSIGSFNLRRKPKEYKMASTNHKMETL